ncbi:MAG: prenyltransferase/squalene oxidase repeat-containing protein [Planctomycetaceae bacterium]
MSERVGDSGASDADKPSSVEIADRELFVRQLQQRARDAAAASVHQAELSQQYLELSKRFAALAERASVAELNDMRHELDVLQFRMAGEFDGSQPPSRDLQPDTTVDTAPSVAAPRPEESNVSPTTKSQFAPPNAADVTVPERPSSDAPPIGDTSGSGPKETTSRRRGRRPLSVRKFVERARSVQLAARRVKIKAKKADLKPQSRSATEELKKGRSSILTSFGFLMISLFLLSLMTLTIDQEVQLNPIMAGFAEERNDEPEEIEPPEEEPGEQLEQETEEPVEEVVEPEPEPESEPAESEPEAATTETEVAEVTLPETPTGTEAAIAEAGELDLATIDNRSAAGREAMLQKYGGSAASESAVGLALEWLASVQRQDGSWDFIDVGRSSNPGKVNNPIGGTAYALLPFLAAGQTHKEGKYRKQVLAGLTYLTNVGVNVAAGYDLRGVLNKGNEDAEPNEAYYVHGAATLALCEALSMTKDGRLKPAAENAVRFLLNSQDPRGGGWRYLPQEPGSTSVTTIQVMALMSAQKAGIRIPENALRGVMHYLDSVQVDGKGRYGYEVEKKQYKGSITAMALLCRMYLGWQRDDGDMADGIALLDKAGPYDNLYTNYFATQTMRNWGGEEWVRWNTRLRDDLIAQQEQAGAEKGSWTPRDRADYSVSGGRLLTTCLATLTLEVYYRYKPLLPERVESKAMSVESPE